MLELPGARVSPDSVAEADDGALGPWPAVTVHPRTAPPWPAIMFVNGATPDGRAHAGVRRFAVSLARAGYIVFIPELPGVAAGELSLPTLAASVGCAVTAADSAETLNGRIGLVGVSVGGTLALLTAASPELSARISVVACIAPFSDLEKVVMLATTGVYPGPDGPQSYPVPPELPVGVARSLAGILDPTPDARALGRVLESLDPTSPDPLSRLRETPCGALGPAAAATQALLVNQDPARFEVALRGASRRSQRRCGIPLSRSIGCPDLGAGRDRHRSAGQVLPARGVARAPGRGRAASNHGHAGARPCNSEADPQKGRRLRASARVHRSLARRSERRIGSQRVRHGLFRGSRWGRAWGSSSGARAGAQGEPRACRARGQARASDSRGVRGAGRRVSGEARPETPPPPRGPDSPGRRDALHRCADRVRLERRGTRFGGEHPSPVRIAAPACPAPRAARHGARGLQAARRGGDRRRALRAPARPTAAVRSPTATTDLQQSLFTRALDLWRGDVLSGLGEEPFAHEEVARLD